MFIILNLSISYNKRQNTHTHLNDANRGKIEGQSDLEKLSS